MSSVQAVLFSRNTKRNSKERKDWLLRHNYIPIKKVHITDQYYWYWILKPNYNKYIYWIKQIDDDIYIIAQIPIIH